MLEGNVFKVVSPSTGVGESQPLVSGPVEGGARGGGHPASACRSCPKGGGTAGQYLGVNPLTPPQGRIGVPSGQDRGPPTAQQQNRCAARAVCPCSLLIHV